MPCTSAYGKCVKSSWNLGMGSYRGHQYSNKVVSHLYSIQVSPGKCLLFAFSLSPWCTVLTKIWFIWASFQAYPLLSTFNQKMPYKFIWQISNCVEKESSWIEAINRQASQSRSLWSSFFHITTKCFIHKMQRIQLDQFCKLQDVFKRPLCKKQISKQLTLDSQRKWFYIPKWLTSK